MTERIVHTGPGFWNLRGDFRLGGVVNIGTQCSLVALSDGGFALLDAYAWGDAVDAEMRALTHDGQDIRYILNLHPFHTVHVAALHERLPHAELFGTARHKAQRPELPWAELTTDDVRLHERFADDLAFSVPRGVDLISADDKVHFSSILALHPASRTLHVDDTLVFLRVPLVDAALGSPGHLRFHPTLAQALQPGAQAATAFRAWARELADRCHDIDTVCTAHLHVWRHAQDGAVRDAILSALDRVEKTLAAHGAA
jgi:hypothetical protein